MAATLWGAWAEDWNLYHKVTFDGAARTIRVNPGVSTVAVKEDIYSAWKEWARLRDHAKFLPALRVIGGDPVGAGLAAGDIYFMTNGWQVVVAEEVTVSGTLYNDTVGVSPFVILPGGGVIATVSNLAYAVSGGGGASASEIADAVHAKSVDAGVDLSGALRLILAALVGKVSGAEGTTITFRGLADDRNRIVATVDANGNRTAIVFDAT